MSQSLKQQIIEEPSYRKAMMWFGWSIYKRIAVPNIIVGSAMSWLFFYWLLLLINQWYHNVWFLIPFLWYLIVWFIVFFVVNWYLICYNRTHIMKCIGITSVDHAIADRVPVITLFFWICIVGYILCSFFMIFVDIHMDYLLVHMSEKVTSLWIQYATNNMRFAFSFLFWLCLYFFLCPLGYSLFYILYTKLEYNNEINNK